MHVPDAYLVQMFGPNAPRAVQQYRNAKEDPILRGLFALFGSTDKILSRFRVENDIAKGFNERGEEVIRVPAREPVFTRPARDTLYQIRRSNST